MSAPERPPDPPRLPRRIVLGLAAGAAAGLLAHAFFPEGDARLARFVRYVAEPVGQIFLRLIFMVVLPLVFSALALGVAGLGDLRRLGRIGARTLLFTLLLSGASVAIGLTLANLVRPGERLPEERRRALRDQIRDEAPSAVEQARRAKPLRDVLLDLIPKNPIQEMVGALDGSSPGGGMLAVMTFAFFFGVGLALAPARAGPLVAALEGLYDVSMAVIGLAMKLAPLGVAALIFSLTSTLGLGILATLALYVGTVVAGLAIHTFAVYPLVLALVARRSPRAFFRGAAEAMLTAFGTSSSSATLPTSLRAAEGPLGITPQVARFVLTVGATANQNGTALYEGVTVLFLAQVFGVDLSPAQQGTVLLMSVLAGVGTAGVPGGSLPLVAAVLLAVGVPAEGIGIILGVDRLLDMCRTAVNVTGDLAIAACVDRGAAPAAPAPTRA
ncbi:MAG TPA: dicarboxylate/amino acid:cation symporter [Planctomycetota bacterium]|nr:dicarboxylate/amino acid:cation symporter [Planctomycetota bacterium]